MGGAFVDDGLGVDYHGSGDAVCVGLCCVLCGGACLFDASVSLYIWGRCWGW
jgi:hypothetical protein